jgi:hypothetical protein
MQHFLLSKKRRKWGRPGKKIKKIIWRISKWKKEFPE